MLYVVPTPIGNLDDLTLRALDTLKGVDTVAAEDTRRTAHLLAHYKINKPLVSYHDHNESTRSRELVDRLKSGESIALVSDAGTPLVSDPGYRLLTLAIEEGVPYTVLPGASAVAVAAAACGFGGGKFHFGGFLPVKSGQRASEIARAIERSEFSLYFESPHRLLRSLEAAAASHPNHRVCVMRELSKQFEDIRHGTAAELAGHYQKHPPKGEIVLAIDGSGKRGVTPPTPARQSARH